MTPFASVAILEKLALLKIAFCKAPVLSSASWRLPSITPSALRTSSRTRESLPIANMAGLCLLHVYPVQRHKVVQPLFPGWFTPSSPIEPRNLVDSWARLCTPTHIGLISPPYDMGIFTCALGSSRG